MAAARSSPLLLLLLATAALSAAASGGDPNAAVHEILPKFGLPKGLLPDSVVSYTLAADGEFTVELAAPCYVQFSSLVYYEKSIHGKMSYGAISDLSGIQAKKLFLWVSVTGIVAHPAAGTVEFKVGFISQTLSASEFESVPKCEAKIGSCNGGRCGRGFLPEELLLISEV